MAIKIIRSFAPLGRSGGPEFFRSQLIEKPYELNYISQKHKLSLSGRRRITLAANTNVEKLRQEFINAGVDLVNVGGSLVNRARVLKICEPLLCRRAGTVVVFTDGKRLRVAGSYNQVGQALDLT